MGVIQGIEVIIRRYVCSSRLFVYLVEEVQVRGNADMDNNRLFGPLQSELEWQVPRIAKVSSISLRGTTRLGIYIYSMLMMHNWRFAARCVLT